MGLNEKFFKSASGGIVADENFNTVTYTGNGSSQAISSVGFQPDMVWVKLRSSASNPPPHALFDSVRGVGKILQVNVSDQEANLSPNGVSSFNSNGFSVTDVSGGNNAVNGASGGTFSGDANYVAWCWYAPTSETNTSGTITTTIKKNVDAGFSIFTYDGATNATADTSNNGGGYYSVGHGLGVAPALVIVKKTSGAGSWYVGGTALGSSGTNGNHMVLNSAAKQVGEANILWGGGQTFNDTTFGLGAWDVVNRRNDSYVAYCFANKSGYQKVGTYTGNGNTNGPIIYTTDNGASGGANGFRPRFIIAKPISVADNWSLWDNVRETGDNLDQILVPNNSGAESANGFGRYNITLSSSGFQIKQTDDQINKANETYLFWAIA